MLSLDDKWVWDFWLAEDAGCWHIYHLQADKTLPPAERHWHASVGHATSGDLANWTTRGTVLQAGRPGDWDDLAIWTGSVLRHHTGRWLMAYTGISREDDLVVERIGLAWSDDLHAWSKDPSNPVSESDRRWYERPGATSWQHGWRDPHLFETEAGYAMLISARTTGPADPYRRGAVALATSEDGRVWDAQPPVPGTTGHLAQLEVPHLVEHEGCTHLIVSTNSDGPWPRSDPAADGRIGTAEFVGEGPLGPYTVGPSFIDADSLGSRYAGRVVRCDDDRLVLLAFVDGGDGRFQGVITDPIALAVDPSGPHLRTADLQPNEQGANLWPRSSSTT